MQNSRDFFSDEATSQLDSYVTNKKYDDTNRTLTKQSTNKLDSFVFTTGNKRVDDLLNENDTSDYSNSENINVAANANTKFNKHQSFENKKRRRNSSKNTDGPQENCVRDKVESINLATWKSELNLLYETNENVEKKLDTEIGAFSSRNNFAKKRGNWLFTSLRKSKNF